MWLRTTESGVRIPPCSKNKTNQIKIYILHWFVLSSLFDSIYIWRIYKVKLLFIIIYYKINKFKKAHNSVGRVIALQAISHRFKSGWAYFFYEIQIINLNFFCFQIIILNITKSYYFFFQKKCLNFINKLSIIINTWKIGLYRKKVMAQFYLWHAQNLNVKNRM